MLVEKNALNYTANWVQDNGHAYFTFISNSAHQNLTKCDFKHCRITQSNVKMIISATISDLQ